MGKFGLISLTYFAVILTVFIIPLAVSKAIIPTQNVENVPKLVANPVSSVADSSDLQETNSRVKRLFYNPYRHYPVVNHRGHHGGGHSDYGGHGGWGGGHHGGWGGGHYGGHGHGHGHGHHG